jgi:hypothetical protein
MEQKLLQDMFDEVKIKMNTEKSKLGTEDSDAMDMIMYKNIATFINLYAIKLGITLN